jgi:hypothetical protein
MVYVIIGDIVRSRSLNNRMEVQKKLKECLDSLNRTYQEDILAEFMITLGDEFQGILESPLNLFEMIARVQTDMKPVKIRFGIGLGDLLIPIDHKMSIGTDGPAWWEARNMIDELKGNEKGLKELSNIRISGLKDRNLQSLINLNLSLCYAIENNWTKDQAEIISHIIQRHGLRADFVQKNIASELHISPSNLNKKLKLSLFYDYVGVKTQIAKLLESEVK